MFQIGVLDQGFWPDGLYTAPSDEALRYDIQVARKLGFTTIRKHHKIEPERWYYWADKLGILVWQDMPGVRNNSPETHTQYNLELKRMIQDKYNHPSIIMWIFDAKGDQSQFKRTLNTLQELDPTRLNNILHTDEGDIVNEIAYSHPVSPEPKDGKIAVIEQFGGLYLDVPGHMWNTNASVQNLVSTQDSQHLSRQYAMLLNAIWHLIESPGLAGAIYTQIADVENQHNGLMTYDRKIIKPIIDLVLFANRGVFPTIPDYNVVIPASTIHLQSWRYTTEKPAEDWILPGFNDAYWQTGKGVFGKHETAKWDADNIWLRREVTIPENIPENLGAYILYDGNVEIYINGVLAVSAQGTISEYIVLPLTPAGRQAILPGRNVLAVHCRATEGQQYIDVGIVER